MYGDQEYRFYKRTGSFSQYCYGHGGEVYYYYTASNAVYWTATDGSYQHVATKARTSTKGGGSHDGPWEYYAGSQLSTQSESGFKSFVARMEQGSAVVVPSSSSWARASA